MSLRKWFGYEQPPGTPRQPTADEIKWGRHLLANVPIVHMVANGRAFPIYSAFTEELTGQPQFLLRSYESARHSQWIERRTRFMRCIGRPAVAPVTVSVVDVHTRRPGLMVYAAGRRATPLEAPMVQDLYNDIRNRREHLPCTLEPEGPRDGRKRWYLFDVLDVDMTLERILPPADPALSYEHVADGYTPLDMAALRGFADLRPPLPNTRTNG